MATESLLAGYQKERKLIEYTDLRWGMYYDCAEVYFANKDYELDIQDSGLLSTIRDNFIKCFENRCWVSMRDGISHV